MRIQRLVAIAWLVAVVAVTPVCAEVMDKEPSAAANWAWAIIGGLVGLAAWRWRWWAGLALLIMVLLRQWGVYSELQDPFVGPAIRAEAGLAYEKHFYWSAAILTLLNGVGAYAALRKSRAQHRLATCAVNASHSAVTARAYRRTRRASGRAGYRYR